MLPFTDDGPGALNAQLGHFGHQLRNLLNNALMAVQVLKAGSTPVTGDTGAVLDRSLNGLRNLIERALSEARLTAAPEARPEPIALQELLDEVRASIPFTLSPLEEGLSVHADRRMLVSAVTHLLRSATRITPPGGHVTLRARPVEARLLLEIADGSLPGLGCLFTIDLPRRPPA